MDELEYMTIQCEGCNELDKEVMRCKYFDGMEERRCFVSCILGHRVDEPIKKSFDSFDISFGGEVI